LAAAITLAVVAAALVRGRVRRTEVRGHSMEPTLVPGDYLVTIARTGIPRRGDIVVMRHPAQPGLDLIKRVVGLPGEIVNVAAGQLHIDGSPLAEPWAVGPTMPEGSWRVGPGRVFLLGDARSRSISDGRTLGPISVADGWWRAVWRYWPPLRMGRP
jgi:signal peptidase I